jgi:hypothetical protein
MCETGSKHVKRRKLLRESLLNRPMWRQVQMGECHVVSSLTNSIQTAVGLDASRSQCLTQPFVLKEAINSIRPDSNGNWVQWRVLGRSAMLIMESVTIPPNGVVEYFLRFSFLSVSPSEFRYLKLGHDRFLTNLSNSSFAYHPFIRRCIVRVTEKRRQINYEQTNNPWKNQNFKSQSNSFPRQTGVKLPSGKK